ncbi:MAG TPA: hypothetical protein V6D47_00190 [Oscillatoriaceae cyanobacterium]
MSEPESPAVQAMREAMRLAAQAAEERQEAKRKGRALERDDEAWQVIVETAVSLPDPEPEEPLGTFNLSDGDDLDALIAQVEATIPDTSDDEVDGDLVIKRPDSPVQPWYMLAAEEVMPAALRGLKGPTDVKQLLYALLVEVGDVKRTNAIVMEMLQRLEEKVDRTNRLMRERRPY